MFVGRTSPVISHPFIGGATISYQPQLPATGSDAVPIVAASPSANPGGCTSGCNSPASLSTTPTASVQSLDVATPVSGSSTVPFSWLPDVFVIGVILAIVYFAGRK